MAGYWSLVEGLWWLHMGGWLRDSGGSILMDGWLKDSGG